MLKTAFKAIEKVTLWGTGWAYLTGLLLMSSAIGNTPDDINDFRVAENLEEYFNYVAQKTVADKSEYHETIPLQMALQADGADLGYCGVDGLYGKSIRKAVLNFQKQHDLPLTGDADPATQKLLYQRVLANPESVARISEKLINPYKAPDLRDMVANIDSIFGWRSLAKTAIRPDLVVYAAIQGNFLDDFQDNPVDAVFADCARMSERDAYRHANSAYKFANYAGYTSAVAVSDVNEWRRFNTLPATLMDIYNHRVASKMGAEEDFFSSRRSQDVIIKGIKQGQFILYPVPMVPKKAQDTGGRPIASASSQPA